MKKLFYSFLILAILGMGHKIMAQQPEEIEEGSLNFPELSIVPEELEEYYEYAQADTILRLAVVLSDIYSKKDMEFTKGLLLGIKQASLPDYSISLKMINGEITNDSLTYELESFGPHVVISTFEKDPPLALNLYSNQHGNKILNVFDAKGADYLYNPEAFQLLSPSEVFNTSIADYFIRNLGGETLLIIGEPDFSDLMIRDLIISWPEENILILTKEDLDSFPFEEDINYLICPIDQNYKEVKDVLNSTLAQIAKSPAISVKILGRPSWVAFNDLNTLISNLEVFIPARCYFDTTSEKGKRFISNYNAAYGHSPIKSYPVFSVMGYDTAKYFLPEFLKELKGENPDWEPANMIQSYFDMQKRGSKGYSNHGSFILHYDPWGTLIKELIQ